MTPAISDYPIPAGNDAIAESGLLAQALMAARPAYAEARFAARQSAAAGLGAGFAHITLSSQHHVVGDFFIELRPDGSARYHQTVSDEARATATAVAADVDDLLTGRLRRLADVVAAIGDEGYSRPVRNAVDSAEATLSAAGVDPMLAAVGDQLMQACLAGASAGSADLALARAREIVAEAAGQHLSWRMDGWSQAAVLLAVNVPIACAAAADSGPEQATSFARYLGVAAATARSGDWQQVGELVTKALAQGHAAALAVLSADLYAEGLRQRDEAQAGPPSPMLFGQKLYQALPPILAAWWISRWADDSGTAPAPGAGPDTWKKRRTDAEELYVRLTDGVFAQWWRYVTAALATERQEIMSVLQDKGKLAANELLRKGEDSYHRPKSLRPYLLGERSTPDDSGQDGS